MSVLYLVNMTLHTLPDIKEKILVVGSIYDKLDKLSKVNDMISNYHITIFNGNLLYPFDDMDKIKDRIKRMDDLLETGKVIYNLGNYDLKLLNILFEGREYLEIQKWIITKPNVIAVDFANTSSILIMSGGVTPSINTRKSLIDNLEVSFVSCINEKPWQIYYGGGLGYIISNNPSTTCEPKFFGYSAQIGTKYSEQSEVYAQEIDQNGLKNTIKL